jgi:hypothetical protein
MPVSCKSLTQWNILKVSIRIYLLNFGKPFLSEYLQSRRVIEYNIAVYKTPEFRLRRGFRKLPVREARDLQ